MSNFGLFCIGCGVCVFMLFELTSLALVVCIVSGVVG